MAGRQCSAITKSESVPDPESNIEPTATAKSRAAPNSNPKLEYRSAYEPIGEPESTIESAFTAEPESMIDGCDHPSRTMERRC